MIENQEVIRKRPGPKPKNLAMTGVSLEAHQVERLQMLADREDRPRSYLIRQAVEKLLVESGL